MDRDTGRATLAAGTGLAGLATPPADRPPGCLARRSQHAAAAEQSSPAAAVAAHGAGEGAGRGAVPPRPVATPPRGMIALPAASCRLSIMRLPPLPSSTTSVWMVPAASVTGAV